MSSSVLRGAAAADSEGAARAGGQEAARPLAQQCDPDLDPDPRRIYVSSYVHVWRRGHCTRGHAQDRTRSPSSHMCAEDYINLRQNSTTTNNECFVYERPGRAKLF